MVLKEFYTGKKVLITGNTGFKGSWLTLLLLDSGATVQGFSLEAPTKPAMYHELKLEENVNTEIGDVRNYEKVKKCIENFKPDIIFHLAAQPIVLEGYRNPLYTYQTNVMGTLNVLEAARNSESVKSIINVTTDKVYRNLEWEYAYREIDVLDGFDPYSNSKSCADLLAACYRRCFLEDEGIALSNVRAGNVIGGGDFAPDRIIPDCVRAILNNEPVFLRNPMSIRPYQHVLEPLYAYCLIAANQFQDTSIANSYNIGPEAEAFVTTHELVQLFSQNAYKFMGRCLEIEIATSEPKMLEANILKLECSRMKNIFRWKTVWEIGQAIEETVKWVQAWEEGDAFKYTQSQIQRYVQRAEEGENEKNISSYTNFQ